MDPVLELQAAILSRLKSQAGVTALVGQKIYDTPPVGATMPYISIGPGNYVTEDVDCVYGGEAMIQVDCWSDASVLSEVRLVAGAVRSALRGWEPSLATNAVVTFDHWRTDYIEDEQIRQASIRYTAIIEEP
ncbi:DUF3168 domain-containing protein [Pseudaminobacter arsenicus]|uniref:DUF3168 domain-containing protein n=1 Tax=Borborobacter arsenicus TaxID=1851146 RepID=A0A432VA58_9HYPH|nr:DUF3168 domain-containing protein [Pseudaminobacter arsenicus]RUM99034.1 DUF3168 domain-containing protein [Pseudaminobacter arsenicus]